MVLFIFPRPPLKCSRSTHAGADDRDKPVKLREVERSMWSMLLGVAAGAFTAENALVFVSASM